MPIGRTMATETLPPVPAEHADFVDYLKLHPEESVHDLVKPYNQFDTVVRKIYAQNPHHPATANNLLNLVPLFDCNGSVDLRIQARDLSSEPESLQEKYIFPLNNNGDRKPSGFPAVVPTLKRFEANFSVFSENSLAGLDWRNVVVAGSAVTTSLLPVPKECEDSKRRLRHFYHDTFAPASDIDLFLYGLTEDQAIAKIKQIEACVSDSIWSETTTVRTRSAITIVSRYPTRHVQIVLRIYRSIAEILTGFDVDCACAAYDGQQVYLAPRAIAAFVTQVNRVDLSRRSPSYESRLSKYSHRGFEVFWSGLDRSRIDPAIFERSFARTAGLARLLVLEKLPKTSDRDAYLAHRRIEHGRPFRNEGLSKKLPEDLKNEWDDEVPEWAEEDDASDYHTFTIPYGKKFHPRKIERLLYNKDIILNAEWNKSNRREVNLHRHPAFFGNAEDVMHDCCGYCPVPSTPEEKQVADIERKLYVSGEIGFLKDNPGRQEIGSFTPIGETDWTEMAYVGDTEGLCRGIVDNDLEGVKQWLSRGIDVNRRDYIGRTPLQLATMTSKPEIVKYLVDQGARLIARLADGRTALHIAAARGSVELVRVLLSKSRENAEKEAQKGDVRKAALRKEHDEVTSRKGDDAGLTSNSSDGSDANNRSFTTGSLVTMKEQDEHPYMLLDDVHDLEPDIYDINAVTSDTRVSPLHLAIIQGHVAVVEELVSSFGADVLLPIKLLNEYDDTPRATILPLVLALQLPKNQANLMTAKLLQLGASPTQVDMQHKTVMYYLAGCMRLDLMDDYLRYNQPAVKSVINVLNLYTSYYSQTESPLMIAIKTGNTIGATKLIEAGADPTCTYGNFVRSVKASGRRITHKTETNFQERVEQPVILSVEEDQPSITMMLLAAGADPNTLHSDAYDVLNKPFLRRSTLGVSLLDCVRLKIKSLRMHQSEKMNVLAPEFLYPDDHIYFKRFQEGTYRYWAAKAELTDARVRFNREEREYRSEVERETNRPGKKEKMAAVNALLLDFEKLESDLLARGAKGFDELHPGINAYAIRPNPRKEPTKYSSFRESDLSPARDDDVVELFEAAWRGDIGTIRALTLSLRGCPENWKSPLEIGITDGHGYTPFAIAVLRGHFEVAKDILAISLMQYKPSDDKKNKVYRIQTSVVYFKEHNSSDDIHLESRVVDPQFTTEDVGEVNAQVESRISPMTVLQSGYPISLFLEKGQRPKENLHGLFEYAIWKDDIALLLFLLTLGQELVAKLSDQPSETSYTVQGSHFQLAMRLGRVHCLRVLITHAGAGLPLDKLAENSGIDVKEKPKYYQGLSVRGKKRNDWAAAARGLRVLRPVDMHPPLLLAAREGNLESLEWFLGSTPDRCYMEFAKAHRHDKRLMKLAETAQGMEQTISNWLVSRHDFVLHCAVLSKAPETSKKLVEYLVQNMPHCLEVKSADGYTPLSLAFYLHRFEIAKILVDAGADQTVRDKMGNNILHLLLRGFRNPSEAELGNFQNMLGIIDPLLVQSLLTERSSLGPGSLNPLALWMNMALPGAEEEREANLRILQMMLDFAESTNQKHFDLLNGAGNTVVHDAIKRQLARSTEFLLERRPELLFRENSSGSTPLELAEEAWIIEMASNPPERGNGSPYTWYNGNRNNMAYKASKLGYDKHPSILVCRPPESFIQNEAGDGGEQSPSSTRTTRWNISDLCRAKARDTVDMNVNRNRRFVTLFEANETARRLAHKAKTHHMPLWPLFSGFPEHKICDYEQKPSDEINAWVREIRLR